MQDIEFTVQQNKLYMLQTRNGKRTAAAALKIAVDMAHEGLIDQTEAMQAGQPVRARPAAAPDARPQGAAEAAVARACRPRPGAACGTVVFNADEAESARRQGRER